MISRKDRMEWVLLLLGSMLLSLTATAGKTVMVNVAQDVVINVVRPEFISVTLDMEHIVPPKWGSFSFR